MRITTVIRASRVGIGVGCVAGAAAAGAQPAATLRAESTTVRAYDGRTAPGEWVRLEVPERRRDNPGTTLTVTALRLPAKAPRGRRATAFLMGGPGIPGTVMAPIPPYFTLFDRLRELGDVLIVDQRGVGQSRPVLDCPFERSLPTDVFTTADRVVAPIRDAAAACAAQWRERGHEPTAFTTVAGADDLDALRAALDVDTLDLVAFSYGTRLALSMMERHGAHLGRVVLQGVNGPGLVVKRPAPVARKLTAMSALLRSDTSWHDSTDLLAAARQARARFRDAPIDVTIDDARLKSSRRLPIGREGFDALVALNLDHLKLPALLVTVARGDDRLLAQFAQMAFNGLGGGTVGLAAREINCAADRPAARRRVARDEARSAPFGAPIDNAFLTDDFCRAIGHARAAREFAGPVRSATPTLLLTGTLDATNPRENAEAVARTLTNATLLDVVDAAHEALTVPAVQEVVMDFLRGAEVRGRTVVAAPPRYERPPPRDARSTP